MADLIRAVLFDVDGTLVDSNYLNTVAWWEAFAQAGHDVQMARIHRAIGKGSDQLLGELRPPTATRRPMMRSQRRMRRCTRCTGPGCGPCQARPGF